MKSLFSISLRLAPVVLIAFFALSANKNRRFNFSRDIDPREALWVDSVFNTLTEFFNWV